MGPTDEKFYVKNEDVFEAIDLFIENRKDEIRCILADSTLALRLKHSENGEALYEGPNIHESTYMYNGVRIVIDNYHPPKILTFVMKEDYRFKFNTPCICGIFEDEPHDFKLK